MVNNPQRIMASVIVVRYLDLKGPKFLPISLAGVCQYQTFFEVFFRIHMKKLNMRFEYEELLFESSNKIHF